jgi:hypothetical protein
MDIENYYSFSIHSFYKKTSLEREVELFFIHHLPDPSIAGLPDLAPTGICGCRGFSGPFPPPLVMSLFFNELLNYLTITLCHYYRVGNKENY